MSLMVPCSTLLVGCCSNVIALEYILRQSTSSGTLVTLCQFLFVTLTSLHSVLQPTENRKFPFIRFMTPVVPLRRYILWVLLFLGGSVLNNRAFGFNIPVPLHIVFRSSAPVASLLAGLCMRRKYSTRKILAVFMLTIGVVMATMASAPQTAEHRGIDFYQFAIGISMLTVGLGLNVYLGFFQQAIYSEFGKHIVDEGLFYSHALSLPVFVFLWGDISTEIAKLNAAPQHLGVSQTWIIVLVNCLTQMVCVQGVFRLASSTSPLTLTVVMNFRKFLNLVISAFLFAHHLSVVHWVGAGFVFSGTMLYVDQPRKQEEAAVAAAMHKRQEVQSV